MATAILVKYCEPTDTKGGHFTVSCLPHKNLSTPYDYVLDHKSNEDAAVEVFLRTVPALRGNYVRAILYSDVTVYVRVEGVIEF